MTCGNAFALRKTKQRRSVSRSPLKFPAEVMAREFGSPYSVIDARIGNQRIVYDMSSATWQSGGIVSETLDAREIERLKRSKQEFEDKNNVLRTKIGLLLEMLCETTAEQEIRNAK